MTISNGWGWCGPRLDTVRSAQPTPAHCTEIRRPAAELDRGVDGGLDLVGLGDVGRDELDGVAQLGGEGVALLGVDVGDRDAGALGPKEAAGRLAQA